MYYACRRLTLVKNPTICALESPSLLNLSEPIKLIKDLIINHNYNYMKIACRTCTVGISREPFYVHIARSSPS